MQALRYLVFIILSAASGLAVRAEATEPDTKPPAQWTITPAVVSEYLFRGVHLAGPSFQPAVDYTNGPLSLGLWTSAAFNGRVRRNSDPECDFYGAYSFPAWSGRVAIVPGFYWYTYPDAGHRNGLYSNTFEPSLGVVFTSHGVQFTPKAYYDVTLQSSTVELTAAIALALTGLGTELDLSTTIGTFQSNSVTAGAAPRKRNWGDYWLVGVAVPVQVSMHSKIVIGFTYSEGRNNFYKQSGLPKQINKDAGRHGALSLSYAITY
jgi:uncharacterized protein (TIGR02001 family)